ncbi:alpha/beta fold hydrolase [Amnibacterium kyonggiense]|uniref:4-carboxymuconolactone decarboxylase /3-oxoadipate enol-lactonase n=1 Tax=Amnibacterium kyonggiense TaxID=595671 RepID=A0A4R7FET8_9MICO|nr:alpha/beta fold hydrolase [Amnibacterium kyonggiense]TDS74455.1 4-carboxymuconolactone decarboxylase /3-oxoadipate enol-lactonase [Amnibacterium kyonggiense]
MSVVLRGVVDPTSSADPGAPLLVLGPSLGTGVAAWGEAAARLTGTFRVVRVDLPGHGLSPAAREPFTFADLADAVVAVVDGLGGGRFVYAGVSIGGAIGVELATGRHRDRLAGLAVICSGARIGSPEGWTARAAQVRAQGTPAQVAASSERWFAPSFPSREPDLVGRTLSELMDADDESYALLAEALGAFDRRSDLGTIAVPTLVVVGDRDPVVTVEDATATAAALPGGQEPVVLTDTGHQAHLERPAEVAALLIERFAPRDRYATGMTVRRAVLGAEWVDRATAGITPETADFQRFITETAWGSIWSRPGLDRRTRRAITIASMVTAHHWEELVMHLRAALADGVTREELVEILLQMAVYAGVPAANSAFRVAKQVFAEADERSADEQSAGE